jgi:hypothetical protein
MTNLAAAINLSNLIKVKPNNMVDCQTYYYYKKQLFCGTKVAGLEPNLDPSVKNYQLQNNVVDDRLWQIVFSKFYKGSSIILYEIADEIGKYWHESITDQWITVLPKTMTLKEYVDSFKEEVKAHGAKPLFTILEAKEGYYIIFEMKTLNPSNILQQDDLILIAKEKEGFHGLDYSIRKSNMGDANRKKWIQILKYGLRE